MSAALAMFSPRNNTGTDSTVIGLAGSPLACKSEDLEGGHLVGHEESIMFEVQARIDALDAGRPAIKSMPPPQELHHQWQEWQEWQQHQRLHRLVPIQRPAVGTLLVSQCSEKQSPQKFRGGGSGISITDVGTPATPGRTKEPQPRPCCLVPFRVAVIGTVVLVALVSSVCTYVPADFLTDILLRQAEAAYDEALDEQQAFINRISLDTLAKSSFSNLLASVGTMIQIYVKQPAQAAVDTLLMFSLTQKRFNPDFSGCTAEQQMQLTYNAWAELSALQSEDFTQAITDGFFLFEKRRKSRIDWLMAGYSCGAFAGARFEYAEIGSNASKIPTARAMQLLPGAENLTVWDIDGADGSIVYPSTSSVPFHFLSRPIYKAQEKLAAQVVANPGTAGSVPLTRLWTELYLLWDGKLGLAYTSPIAPCGNYSCFEGVVAASLAVDSVSLDCYHQWLQAVQVLSTEFGVSIGVENSTIFVIVQKSSHVGQQGVLVGASHADFARKPPASQELVVATASTQQIVKDTAWALLGSFGSWDSPELLKEQVISYRPSAMQNFDSPVLVHCDPLSVDIDDLILGDCHRVGTLSVQIDEETSWLVVVVMPLGAFSKQASLMDNIVDAKVSGIRQASTLYRFKVRQVGIGAFLAILTVAIIVSIGMGMIVSRALHQLSKLMIRIQDLDFAQECDAFHQLQSGRRSRIREIHELQASFCKLSRSIEAFARFIPEAVVRNVVRGDPRATRLHVSRRDVTIMFSDLRNFTSMAENLSQRDLLFVLTRYLSVVTHIVELFQGVVAEFLGDGVLAYWNTPELVQNHAAKACAAALAHQQAMAFLNAEMDGMNIPELAVRIGLHTGHALTGNIGTDRKMKFGCMGDPVNLASRLEGLCKHYGVGIICSEATKEQLPGAGFICRRLDLVQVKGRTEPTTIYEILGREADENTYISFDGDANPHDIDVAMGKDVRPCKVEVGEEARLSFPHLLSEHNHPQPCTAGQLIPRRRLCAQLYEEALTDFQAGHFSLSITRLTTILDAQPDDTAAKLLLERSRHHLCSEGLSEEEMSSWTGVCFMTEK